MVRTPKLLLLIHANRSLLSVYHAIFDQVSYRLSIAMMLDALVALLAAKEYSELCPRHVAAVSVQEGRSGRDAAARSGLPREEDPHAGSEGVHRN